MKNKVFRVSFKGKGWSDPDCEAIFLPASSAQEALEWAKWLMVHHWEIDPKDVEIYAVEDKPAKKTAPNESPTLPS